MLSAIANAFKGQMEPPTEWAHGVCGCCEDVPATVESLFCPCVFLGATSGVLKQRRAAESFTGGRRGDQDGFDGGTCCLTVVLMYFLGCFGVGLFAMTTRQDFRRRYNVINDDAGSDCPVACCCPICSMVQVSSTMKYIGVWGGSLCSKAELRDKRGNNIGGNQVIQMGGGSPNQFQVAPQQQQNQSYPPQGYNNTQQPQGYNGQYYNGQQQQGGAPQPPPVQYGGQPQQQQPQYQQQQPQYQQQQQWNGGAAPSQLPPPSFQSA